MTDKELMKNLRKDSKALSGNTPDKSDYKIIARGLTPRKPSG
jgi:hypothetical protein